MTLPELLPAYVQAGALVLAGLWAYWRFFYQQNHEPATDIDVDVALVGEQDGCQIIEVTATLENKSLVRHWYEDFRITVRYLLAGDSVQDGSKDLHHQMRFLHSIDERIDARRYFANVAYINPRQRFRHRYVTFVPIDTTVVWVHCKFAFMRSRKLSLRPRPSKPDDRVFADTQKVVWIARGRAEVEDDDEGTVIGVEGRKPSHQDRRPRVGHRTS